MAEKNSLFDRSLYRNISANRSKMKRDKKIISLCQIALEKELRFKEFLKYVFNQMTDNEKEILWKQIELNDGKVCQKCILAWFKKN